MQKILIIFIVGILVLSGLGAIAIPENNIKVEKRSIGFSHPILTEENDFLKINLKEANSLYIKDGKPLLPSYIYTFTFPYETKIKSIACAPKNIKQQKISKNIIPSPVALSAGFTISKEKYQVSEVDYGIDPYPNNWYTYDIGVGKYNGEQSVILKVQFFPVQYYPANDMIK